MGANQNARKFLFTDLVNTNHVLYMLWFKSSFGAKFLKLVQFLFSFVVYSFP